VPGLPAPCTGLSPRPGPGADRFPGPCRSGLCPAQPTQFQAQAL